MQPIGISIQIWRTHKRLTQAALARACGVSRPNLSAIERGSRDLTVATLRRIASAIDVSPGTLVDGVLPIKMSPIKSLTSSRLNGIARRAIGHRVKLSRGDAAIAQFLAMIASSKMEIGLGVQKQHYGKREIDMAHYLLKAHLGFDVLSKLVRALESALRDQRKKLGS